MIKKIINSIKKGTFFINIRKVFRIGGYIKNKNVYHEYTVQKEYYKLEKKYKSIIREGVDISLPRNQSNKIWICWLQGLDEAPELVKACVASVKKNMPDKEVIILNKENISQYIQLPEHIIKKVEKGCIPLAHFSDILRVALLCKYGGGWLDSTVLCTSNNVPNYISNANLFVYQQVDLVRQDNASIVLSNWLIFAESNHPILLLTLKLLYQYWRDNNHITQYFFFHILFTLATRRYPEEWNRVPVFNNRSPHILQFELKENFKEERWEQIKAMSCFHKLNRYEDFSENNNSFYNYIISEYGEKQK